ncbi:pantoate--beta-alanine ligase [Prevotella sp. oral taxon 475]|uniref:pantoate--beta-alanine ligase n=1 Tax=Prevotella sp. oral taxon 475 TaxID=712471 RepID=UPI001BAC7F3E|nr:pantoate--beta-alanine ligase [Prevotella sp. oral taxon 475]QUB46616.1 pantoate--beta-alanine ligase [Prevotella sp. oral taxon 475]
MKVFTKIVDLQNALFCQRKKHVQIGFVPTMGALHEGHASLVRRSVEENGATVVSIFLNPNQFNDQSDLENYPQTLEADCALLEGLGADYVFTPSVAEIYPQPDTREFSFPPATTVMEGERRPGHFNGVCQVLSRLFAIVKPDRAYFGEKDWQQIAVVKQLVRYMGAQIQIVECPIVREASGLAMSSRNERLTTEERVLAANIFDVLKRSLVEAKSHSLSETRDWVTAEINAHEGLEVEYFSIVDGETLEAVDRWDDSQHIVGCITVYCGSAPIRLIDHITYKG